MPANNNPAKNDMCDCGRLAIEKSIFCQKCYDKTKKKNDKVLDIRKVIKISRRLKHGIR